MKIVVPVALVFCALSAYAAAVDGIVVSADRSSARYSEGETANFTILVKAGDDAKSCQVEAVVTDDAGIAIVCKSFPCTGQGAFKVPVKMSRPGFWRCVARSNGSESEWGIACAPEKIKTHDVVPGDFDDYWQNALSEANKLPLDSRVVPADSGSDDVTCSNVSFSTVGGGRMHGTLSVPRSVSAQRLPVRVLIGEDPVVPQEARQMVVLRMNPVPTSLDEKGNPLRASILGLCRAVDWVAALQCADSNDVTCCASGDTGALGYCVMGVCRRFRRGAVHGTALPAGLSRWKFPYFSCSAFAGRIQVPVLAVAGFVDGLNTPCETFAAYNAVGCRRKRIVDGLGMGSGLFPRLKTSMDAWLMDHDEKELHEIRAVLLHLGYNMWCDWFEDGTDLSRVPESVGRPDAKLRCKDEHWRTVTDRMAERGVNMLVLDVGEGLIYPSHPELAIEGSWSVSKLKTEIARLKTKGIETIPKLNFSTTHNGWLKQYRRMVGTPQYRRIVEDLLKDVAEVFDRPRFCHIGYDEERELYAPNFEFVLIRKGQAWERDFLHVVRTCESLGMRPWAWSDYTWHHPDFLERCPKSVVFSNWYYDENNLGYSLERNDSYDFERLKNFYDIRDAGFDQIPCGTNWVGLMRRSPFIGADDVIGRLVGFCRGNIPGKHLLGFMMASWEDLGTEKGRDFTLKGIDLFAGTFHHATEEK